MTTLRMYSQIRALKNTSRLTTAGMLHTRGRRGRSADAKSTIQDQITEIREKIEALKESRKAEKRAVDDGEGDDTRISMLDNQIETLTQQMALLQNKVEASAKAAQVDFQPSFLFSFPELESGGRPQSWPLKNYKAIADLNDIDVKRLDGTGKPPLLADYTHAIMSELGTSEFNGRGNGLLAQAICNINIYNEMHAGDDKFVPIVIKEGDFNKLKEPAKQLCYLQRQILDATVDKPAKTKYVRLGPAEKTSLTKKYLDEFFVFENNLVLESTDEFPHTLDKTGFDDLDDWRAKFTDVQQNKFSVKDLRNIIQHWLVSMDRKYLQDGEENEQAVDSEVFSIDADTEKYRKKEGGINFERQINNIEEENAYLLGLDEAGTGAKFAIDNYNKMYPDKRIPTVEEIQSSMLDANSEEILAKLKEVTDGAMIEALTGDIVAHNMLNTGDRVRTDFEGLFTDQEYEDNNTKLDVLEARIKTHNKKHADHKIVEREIVRIPNEVTYDSITFPGEPGEDSEYDLFQQFNLIQKRLENADSNEKAESGMNDEDVEREIQNRDDSARRLAFYDSLLLEYTKKSGKKKALTKEEKELGLVDDDEGDAAAQAVVKELEQDSSMQKTRVIEFRNRLLTRDPEHPDYKPWMHYADKMCMKKIGKHIYDEDVDYVYEVVKEVVTEQCNRWSTPSESHPLGDEWKELEKIAYYTKPFDTRLNFDRVVLPLLRLLSIRFPPPQ